MTDADNRGEMQDVRAVEKIPVLSVVIDNKVYGTVRTFEEASKKYSFARDEAQLGSSELPKAKLVDESGKVVAHVSYNGKVWAGETYKSGQEPLYNPFLYEESRPKMTREQMLEKASGILQRQALREELKASKTGAKIKDKSSIPRPFGKKGEAGFIDANLATKPAELAKRYLTTKGDLPKEMFDAVE